MEDFSTIDATNAGTPRRLEVLSGESRRRTCTDALKARLVAETLQPGVCAADLARRHGLHPQQIYTWRRQARRGQLVLQAEDAPMFVPALASEPPMKATVGAAPGEMVIEFGGFRVRIGAEVAPEHAAALAAALKARA